jgi:hypothetical protein
MSFRLSSFLVLICFLVQTIALPQVAFAQAGVDEVRQSSGPRRQLATIIFAGLAGAILGLSTLSFYGRPQDKLSNIAVGFALGIIVGASYTTYKTATEPYEYLGVQPIERGRNLIANKPNLKLAYQWHF